MKDQIVTEPSCCNSVKPLSQVEQMTREISYLASRIEEYNRVIKFHQEHPDVVALLKEKNLEVHCSHSIY